MSKPAIKVLFVINAAITGGAERHTAVLARDLAAAGFTTAVFAARAGTERPTGCDLREPERPTPFLRRARDLARTLDGERWDVVVAVNQRPLALVAAARVMARHKPPVAVIFHTTMLRNRKEEMMQRGYDLLFNRADLVVFVSENQRRHWRARGMRPRRDATIVNGIDRAAFSPPTLDERAAMRKRLGFAASDYVLGCSAMLRAEKNHRQLVEAVAALRAESIPARCLLVGDGPMMAPIRSLADALGIGEHVVTVGRQGDVRRYIAAFDIGVLCSTSVETLSLSALEIMSMGVPMAMSDIGGANEIVAGTAGRVFAAGHLADMVALCRDWADPSSRTAAGSASRQRVAEHFDIGRMNASYADHFRDLVGEAGRPDPQLAGSRQL